MAKSDAQHVGDRLVVTKEPKKVQGKQGPVYNQGVSAELTGSRAIHLQTLSISPGAMERAHKHTGHETAIFIISGRVIVWWGDDLVNCDEGGPGSFIYIPANVPHMPRNFSDTEPCVGVIARTDPNEQESVMLLPGLEERWTARQR